MTASDLAVFEVLNGARKEIFVGVAPRRVLELLQEKRGSLPAEVSHWAPAEELSIRSVSDDMPAQDAWRFAGVYVSYIERDGWTIIRQSPDG